ncbi:hypothetical protein AWB79_00547 [Caballeronia hypogeia]|uniref:Uncharacterized protein n=1 Tax=Caballeronia hypogeia TaxID=1777140 RepID=A0A157Z9R6_9BURK|nr:hypothetical protein AWB79_00547 [Caballeronia hypogeia]
MDSTPASSSNPARISLESCDSRGAKSGFLGNAAATGSRGVFLIRLSTCVCSRDHEPTSLFARSGVIFLKFRRDLTGFSVGFVGNCGSVTIQPHWRRAVPSDGRSITFSQRMLGEGVSRRDDASICRGKANQVKAPGPEIPGHAKCAQAFPEHHPRSVSRGVRPRIGVSRSPERDDALHAGNASAGVAKTSPYIEEASR